MAPYAVCSSKISTKKVKYILPNGISHKNHKPGHHVFETNGATASMIFTPAYLEELQNGGFLMALDPAWEPNLVHCQEIKSRKNKCSFVTPNKLVKEKKSIGAPRKIRPEKVNRVLTFDDCPPSLSCNDDNFLLPDLYDFTCQDDSSLLTDLSYFTNFVK